jgi:AcrR family transcriptional regulator
MDTGRTDQANQPRRRDAAATRQSLLTAARTLMAQHGVEGTSTRDVASAAGVNQALVYRYFGSKEKLFAEAVGGSTTTVDSVIDGTPLTDLPHALLGYTLEMSAASEDSVTDISRFLGAANDTTVRAILRDHIDTSFGTRLADRLDGPDAALRAELLAALITGIGFLRGKVGTRAISNADPEILGAYVDRMTAPLLASDAPATACSTSAHEVA